jgi:hypothetical protein
MLKERRIFLSAVVSVLLCSCYYPSHNPDNIQPPAIATDSGTFSAPAIAVSTAPFQDLSILNIPERGIEKMSSDFVLIPYIPQTYLDLYYGTQHALQGKADLLEPIYFKNDRNFYVYGQWRLAAGYTGSQNTWTTTAGLGYRQVLGSQIYGLYLLADYSNLPVGSDKYWVFSPGIESLGKWVDFRVNGYFPQTKTFASSYLNNPTATSNQILADKYVTSEQTGNGADAEVGVKLFSIYHMPLKAFINGYYFNIQDHDAITGIGGRITFQPTRYLIFELKDSYDNKQHNIFLGGIKLYFNGMVYGFANNHVDDQDIQARLYDPIERSFGVLNVGTSTPVITNKPAFVGQILQEDHDIFAEPGSAAGGSGTAEDPYIYTTGDLQTILDDANSQFADYSHIIFAPGNYNISNTTGNAQLYGGQTMRGAELGFVTPAQPGQVNFFGGLTLGSPSDTNHNYELDNFTLLNGSISQTQGISIQNGSSVTLNNLVVGQDSGGTGSYQTGIVLNSSNISIVNSTIIGFSNTAVNGVGLNVVNGGAVTASKNSNILGTATGAANNGIGLLVTASTADLTIGNLGGDGTATFGGDSANGIGYGFFAKTTGKVSIGNISGLSFLGSTYGFDAEANSGVTVQNISNSDFEGANTAFRVSTGGTASLGNITNNTYSAAAGGTDFYISGSTMQVNAKPYTSSQALDLYKVLSSTNDFDLTTRAVCIGANCAP